MNILVIFHSTYKKCSLKKMLKKHDILFNEFLNLVVAPLAEIVALSI